MKTIFLVCFIALTSISLSQNIHFIKSYGNNGYDFGRDIKQDIDTGYIATGSSSSFWSANADAFLLKVDSLGNFKWSYNYGGTGSEWGEAVLPTSDGGYAVGGYTNSYGAGGFDFYFVKTNEFGVPQLEKTYGGPDWDKAYDMVQLPDSSYILVGETFSYGNGNNDVYIVRIDQYGDTIWTQSYGGPEADYARAVLLDGDSIVVVGGTESFGNGMTDGIILKYHIDGTFGWVKTAGMEKDDYFTSITENLNSDYYIGGSKDYKHHQDCDCGYDFWIYRTNSNGAVIVDTSWTGEQVGTDHVLDIAVDPQSNNIYYAGSTTSWGTPDIAQGNSDAFIGKLLNTYYTASSFVKNFGTNGSDEVAALDFCFDRGIVGIGTMIHNSTGGGNLFIVRVDKNNSSGVITVTTELTNEVITLSVNEVEQSNMLYIYPTVVTDLISIDNLPELNSIKIFNLNGQNISDIENSNGLLDFSGFNSGFYILEITIQNKHYSYKVIKQ